MSEISRNVRMKRVYDPPSPDDGYRVLITRYWPRGIKGEAVDEYDTKVAPSHELLREFKHERLPWDLYTKRYLQEMESEESQRDIERLVKIARTRTITLMCVCEDENRCHRSLLRKLINERTDKATTGRIHRGSQSQGTRRSRAVQAQPAGGAGVSPATTSRAGRVGRTALRGPEEWRLT